MSSLVSACTLIGCVLMMSLWRTHAAPTRQRRRIADTDTNTLFSVLLDDSDSENTVDSSLNFDDLLGIDHSRNKRSASHGHHHSSDLDIPVALDEEDLRELTPAASRRRRSAVFSMAAMVRLCAQHNICRQVQISEDDFQMTVRLVDE